jgi:3',5'-cyclic AMP phosphodiesterase CpdA
MNRIITLSDIKPGFQFIDKEEITVQGIRRLLLIGDAGCSGFYEDSRNIFGQLLDNRTDLILFLGDLTFTGAKKEYQEIIDFCNSRVQAPVFSLCGNHDILYYEAFLGLTSYALVLDTFVCLFLSNQTGHFSERTLEFLADSLKKHRDKHFMILIHIPPPTDIHRNHMSQAEWEKLRTVLDPHRQQITRIFCGHLHGYHEYQIDGYAVTITAGGGAAMIYDLKMPGQKIHHAIAIDLHRDGKIHTELLIAKRIDPK